MNNRKRILMVDDQPEVCEQLHMLVEALDYEVTSTTSPEKALREFEAASFDAVLTDFSMPGMNGGELARQVKELKPGTPVVMITGMEHYVPDNAIDGLIYKPPQLAELKLLLGELLS